MRSTRLLVLALLVATGCGRKKLPPEVVVPQAPAAPGLAEQGGPEARPEVAAGPVYQGQTGEIGPSLQDRDPAKRAKAGAALSRMGEKGGAFLIQGMRNSSAEVRLGALQSATRTQLLQQRRESMALLMGMTNDSNPAIRKAAAGRLAWYEKDSVAALPLLQRMAKDDEDPEVRQVAVDALAGINEYVNSGGKYTRGVKPPDLRKK